MVLISQIEYSKIKLDSLQNNIRTDTKDLIDTQFNVDSSEYIKKSILSETPNIKKEMAELLESNRGTRMLATDSEEEIDIIDYNTKDEVGFMKYESSETL